MLLLAPLLALQTAAPEPAPPRARGWDDFPVFVWREEYAGKPLPDALAEPFGGVILMREEDSSWARARGLAYLVWNAAGRDALHLDADEAWSARVEEWIETHDEKLLVRAPCLNDPKTIEKLRTTLAATIAKHGEHPGLGLVLGDEVSLTPNGDPFELCRCARCEEEWRSHARALGLPERAPLTDEVRAGLLDDDFTRLGAWLERRRFDQEQILTVLDELIASSGVSPMTLGPPLVGLLGCSGQTAFGGVALERLANRLGLVECYPAGAARELITTVPYPSPRARLTTVFAREESAAGLAWCVFDAWLRGENGLVLWNDAQLEALPAASRARLAEALTTVRGLAGQSADESTDDGRAPRLRFLPEAEAAAIVTDADSTAVSFLRDALLDGPTWPRRRASYQREHGRLERKVETWLRLLEDCGLQPGSLPLGSVCARCTQQFDVLVLPEVLVVGDDDLERLAAFVDGGGTLVIDGTLGWVGRDGKPRDGAAARERLARQHPARVLDAPDAIAGYLDAREDAERAARIRRFVLALPALERRRAALAEQGFPTLGGAAANVPWYVHVFERDGDALGLALLPNHPTHAERARSLRDVPLDGIRAPTGFTLEWIHPADGKTLRAGDAAVLRIHH